MKRILCALGLLLAMSMTPPAAAQTLYMATGSNGGPGTLYIVNPATAGASLIGPTTIGASPIGMTGLAFHPTTGVLYGVTANSTAGGATNIHSLVTIDKATGAATLIGSMAAAVGDITFDSGGTLYGWQTGTTTPRFLVRIDLATGLQTQVGIAIPGLTSTQGNGIAFVKGTLFLVANGSGGPIRTVDPVAGTTALGPLLTGAPQLGSIAALAADPDGVLFGVDTDQSAPTACNLVVIDPATGAVTNRGALPTNMDALAFTNSGIQAVVPTSLFPLTPCRLLDTRTTSAIAAGSTRVLAVTGGRCGVPAAAVAVSLNVTVTNVVSNGHLALFATNQAVPVTTSLEFRAGLTRGNNTIVAVATDGSGEISIENVSGAAVDVVVDVNGYFQ